MKLTTAMLVELLGVAMFCTSSPTSAAAFLPDFYAATFSNPTTVDHAYFPLVPGVTRTYAGSYVDEHGETQTESFQHTTLATPGPELLGVETVVLRDRAFENNLLVEDTFDYYAQDDVGNVWYMGEDVTNYVYDDDDNLIATNTSSSWLAGVNSGVPGWIMPADLSPAINYYQEWSPFDAAIDEGTTLASDREYTIGAVTYTDVLAVLETLDTDPDVRAIKYYAPGIGLIAEEEGLNFSLTDAELTLQLVNMAPVPLPAPLLLLGTAMAGLSMRMRRSR